MNKNTQLKLISMLVPYAAVLIGLYLFRNGLLAFGLYHIGMIAFLITHDRSNLLKKIRSGWNMPAALISAVACALIIPVIFLLWRYMQLESSSLKATLSGFRLYGVSWYIFMIYFCTVQPLLEELFWRGYLDSSHKYLSWPDLAFAGYHILVLAWFIKMPWLLLSFIILSMAAWGWRHIAHKFRGLAVPLFSHVVADISIITATNLLIR